MRNRDMPATPAGDGANGLTKREAAAIAAMQGFIAAPATRIERHMKEAAEKGLTFQAYVAQWACRYADTLFNELEKTDD